MTLTAEAVGRIIAPVAALYLGLAAAGCTPPGTPVTPPPGGMGDEEAGLANPASVFCEEQGGTVAIESRPDGGQYGVCAFDDDKECEEWAMLRGRCPVGGVEVERYVTDAARYCAITGGSYGATANNGGTNEEGECTLPSGETCDAQEYFEGTCPTEGALRRESLEPAS